MDLSKTIAELEKQAAQYTAAAQSLRALGGSSVAAVVAAAAPAATRGPGRPAAKAGGRPAKDQKAASGKRYVSPETRAKIAAAIKARHDEKRRAREAG